MDVVCFIGQHGSPRAPVPRAGVSRRGSQDDAPQRTLDRTDSAHRGDPARRAGDPLAQWPYPKRESWESWGASLLLHAACLLILAVCLIPERSHAPEILIDSAIGTPEGGEAEIDTALFAADAAPPASLENAMLPVSSLLPHETTEIPIELTATGGNPVEAAGDTGQTVSVGGAGSRRGVGFFGTEAAGRSFVFIVDSSGSMQGHRFGRARAELFKTLLQLEEHQTFHVIFYNHVAIPMRLPGKSPQTLLPASADVLRLSRKWIKDQSPGGGTVPDEAIRQALRLKPDVIFLMSDGRFERTARTAALQSNTSGTVIHTIAFEYRGGETILQGIAEDHGGRYRFVP